MRLDPDDFERDPWRERLERNQSVPQPIPGGSVNTPVDVAPPDIEVEDPDFGMFSFPSYSGPSRPNIQIGHAPKFSGPRFKAPSFEDAMNDPGYRFRAQAGSDAMERSAAARGTLRTGGTLKDLAEWNQNFAAQEYKGVFDRTLQGYDRDYRAAYDEYAPRYGQWQMQSGANQASALAEFQRIWDMYQLNVENARWQDDRVRSLALPSPSPEAAY